MGGRLAHFAEKWEEITDNKWVLSIVRNGFRIPFIKIPPLSSVPIRMSQSSSPFLREEIENLLNKQAVERVQNPGTPGFYSRIFLVPKKERKVSFYIRPVFIKPLHRETSIQNGNSQIGKTSDETQRLGCLHRFNRCISTRADTSSIQEVSSLRTRRSSISLFGPTVRNVPILMFDLFTARSSLLPYAFVWEKLLKILFSKTEHALWLNLCIYHREREGYQNC